MSLQIFTTCPICHVLRHNPFLNHRQFMRSDVPERVGKSPKELMTGQGHPHWLEMLGFKRFQLA